MRTRAIKLILGHSQKRDVTNSVYTHTDISYLKKELSNAVMENTIVSLVLRPMDI